MRRLPDSTLEYLLKSLIPYTEANLTLTFKPVKFFSNIEKISKRNRQTIRNSYYKAIKLGLVTVEEDKIPRLTPKGINRLQRFSPGKLSANAQLMVIFDIPEAQRVKRQRLRVVLREFKFLMVQQSVWVTNYDCEVYVRSEVKENQLEDYVALYEVAPLE